MMDIALTILLAILPGFALCFVPDVGPVGGIGLMIAMALFIPHSAMLSAAVMCIVLFFWLLMFVLGHEGM